MALTDWIELSDDAEIIELSSSEENVEEYQGASTQSNSAQHQATLHDDQTMFVTEGERREEATESGNAEEATASSSVTEKESGNPEEATVSETCPHTPTAVVTLKESRNPDEATVSQTCPHTTTAVTFPGPDPLSPKALTFQACVAKPRRAKAKRRRKLFHADTPWTWRSPRLEDKHKGRRRPVEELAVERKASAMPEEEEQKNTSARSRRKCKVFGKRCNLGR
ncbi:uncharacterized protein LOC119331521 [Triticum dicoccoides]|uniref:uncharacterized protein LOC119331521 n=1 Tax=Triticum dicoccoides TaxID=85692 RepID=UPI001890EBCA|nr:uncharacterized protein LOC119331521 [Triticum dicoccoides]